MSRIPNTGLNFVFFARPARPVSAQSSSSVPAISLLGRGKSIRPSVLKVLGSNLSRVNVYRIPWLTRFPGPSPLTLTAQAWGGGHMGLFSKPNIFGVSNDFDDFERKFFIILP
jgi:hypothetical protein